MQFAEYPSADSYKVGEGEWEPTSALPDMWKIVHQCQEAGLDMDEIETVVHLYIFFKQHSAATLEEFLAKLAEGAKKEDYYEFGKYCIALDRKVHEMQLASGLNRIEEPLIRERMKGAEEMDQLGDEYHEDPKSDYWQTSASMIGPDYRELPRSYVKLMGSYKSFEEFMAAHKKFVTLPDTESLIQAQMRRVIINRRRDGHAGEIRTALDK